MKELSKSESILNEYVMNTSELASSHDHIFTQQSINNNLSLKLLSRESSIKESPFNKFSMTEKNNVKPNPISNSKLINSIECNNIKKIIEYLEKDKVNINKLNEKGLSPLHIAVINGNLEIINILLKNGADPNIKSLNKKQTPLHLAYIFKSLATNEIINLLIKYNSNPNIEDIYNKKPHEYYLKYKESNEVENTLSNEIENDNDEIIEIGKDIQIDSEHKNKRNYINNIDSYNENKNNYTYTISDNEATISQTQTKKNSLYYIEELINCKEESEKENRKKIRIIGKKNGKKLHRNNSNNNYNFKKEKKSILNINNNYFLSKQQNNIFDDSFEINIKNGIFNNNIFDNFNNQQNLYNQLKSEKCIFGAKKPLLNRSYQDLRVKNKNNNQNISIGNNFYQSNKKIKDKEININEQYYFNNEFFNNYYQDKGSSKLFKGKRRSFKMPKSNENCIKSGLLSSMASTHNQTYSKERPNENSICNDVKEFTYLDELNNYSESEKLKILENWLILIELPFYFDNFINNNIYDISFLIDNNKRQDNIINYEYIENLLKIHKPGHIYRILCKLEVDAGFVENKICNFLVDANKNSIKNNAKNDKLVYLQTKESCGKCYNCYETKKSLMEKRDLMTFLRKYNLLHLYDNFEHNGFNLINFVILQMFTKYSINDDIIQKCFHIYKKKDRFLVLSALFNEVKEINIFFSTNIHNHYLFPKYENNDWENSWNDENISTETENSNKCIII